MPDARISKPRLRARYTGDGWYRPTRSNRQVEHMHGPGAAHKHIPNPGDHIHIDVLVHTVFEKDVPVVAVDAAEEHGLHGI